MDKALEPQVFFNYFGPDNAKELDRLNKVENFGGYHQDRTHQTALPDHDRRPTSSRTSC